MASLLNDGDDRLAPDFTDESLAVVVADKPQTEIGVERGMASLLNDGDDRLAPDESLAVVVADKPQTEICVEREKQSSITLNAGAGVRTLIDRFSPQISSGTARFMIHPMLRLRLLIAHHLRETWRWTVDVNGVPLWAYQWAHIVVFWDIENCPVPADCDADWVRDRILGSLWNLGYRTRHRVEIVAVAANETRVPAAVSLKLRRSGIELETLNTTRKQASDVRIIQRMNHWMADTPGPATLLLITGDKDFAMSLRKVERAGYNTILASDEGNVSRLLQYVGHKQLTWRELLLLEG